ncbi:hypothetical protein EIP86_005580 [Pleurotus ostreatoroseus]|nr:hypothetical protein EIP86_005580 [Pleurotus ostreatoroseus]
MPRRARIHYVSLRSSLVNLPISIYGPLLERGVRPQGLAVHLTQVTPGKQKTQTEDGRTTGEAYLGWTGMVSASSLAQFHSGGTAEGGLETVEIDPQLAQGLGFAENDIVEIGLLHDLSYATSVATEPLTADDWEILELHATHVESTMLSQVRVAVVGQEIDVWVLGRTRVRLLVVSVEPQAKGKALLLTTSTEVSIAPKTRTAQVNGNTSAKSSLTNGKSNGTLPDKGKAKVTEAPTEDEIERRRKCTRVLRHLPARILPSFSPTCPTLEDGSVLAVGFVAKHTLNMLTDQPHDATPKTWVAQVWRLPPPADPSAPSGSQNPALPAAPKVLVPTDSNTKGSSVTDEKKPDNEILVAWSPELPVPGGHISLHGSVASIEDWDQVRIEFVRESEEVISSLESDVTPISQLDADSRTKLAGVNDILEECKSFCITTYSLHAVSGRINGVPGLLVTGRSGSGKTSIFRAVAKSLTEDPRVYTYTLYVDLAKYVETPVSKLKPMIKYWFDKAWWHKPSVVVLDNLDKLMGIELEVGHYK